ncbi:uncharacterized protein C2orf81 homolog [Bufo bufo]|uniref:uncharacterized protein C2orf81 homolog n=1 Tax=Bufo bufo TaxID=8384 RepID=UPI001ABE0006|nr:uncharacterized protein C2orf81 homolog [Bufo bufo]
MSSKTGERARGGTSGQGVPRNVASKSRGDKSRNVTVASLPQVTVDIIPGRFTEEDWLSMLTAEAGEDVVGDLVDSLMDRVMEECFKVYLQHQLLPFTVSQSRDAMLQVVQWTFVPRDEGDSELNTEVTPQTEPQPSPHDSWAQGCVPVTQASRTPRSSQPQVSTQPPITDIPEQEGEEAGQAEEPTGAEEDPPAPAAEPATSAPQAPPPPVITPSPPAAPPKTRPHYRPHRGPLRSAGLKNITKSLEETEKEMFLEQLVMEGSHLKENADLLPTSLHNILKIQVGRPPQKKDVIYDGAGNVLSMPKVDLSRLPQHHVRPRIEVLEISKEAPVIPLGGRQLPRRSRERVPDRRLHVKSSSRDPPQLLLHSKTTRVEDISGRAPVPSNILLDTMPLTHGVILREGGATERGTVYSLRQREHPQREVRQELRSIPASIPLPGIRVEQLIKNSVPQVQPLVSFLSPPQCGI